MSLTKTLFPEVPFFLVFSHSHKESYQYKIETYNFKVVLLSINLIRGKLAMIDIGGQHHRMHDPGNKHLDTFMSFEIGLSWGDTP